MDGSEHVIMWIRETREKINEGMNAETTKLEHHIVHMNSLIHHEYDMGTVLLSCCRYLAPSKRDHSRASSVHACHEE
jgi:hypothetical protein